MKISKLITALQVIQEGRGDIEVDLYDNGEERGVITSYPDFFIVEEGHENDEFRVRLSSWPY